MVEMAIYWDLWEVKECIKWFITSLKFMHDIMYIIQVFA
jgi:hypothetical protein